MQSKCYEAELEENEYSEAVRLCLNIQAKHGYVEVTPM